MKIVIPMGGEGKRFLAAGIRTPKPFMEVDGLPVIRHIVDHFSGDDAFVFGVNEAHLKEPEAALLKSLAANQVTVPVPYQKDGPIGVVRRLFSEIKDEEPVIVNYCDFSWVWDYEDFKSKMRETGCDGAVICYRGFHPHLLGPNRYATLDGEGLWMKEIREKHSWHDDKQKDWTSSGTYYFKKGAYVKKYFESIREKQDWKINGEFYVSQIYQLMKEDGLEVYIYEIPYMLQWGTPEDLEQYRYWSDFFRRKQEAPPSGEVFDMQVLILMAGAGRRFREAGYSSAKPFIEVDGMAMAAAAARFLPRGRRYEMVTRRELADENGERRIGGVLGEVSFLRLDKMTQGQASTALIACETLEPEAPLLIGACDHALLYDAGKWKAVSENAQTDALIFTYRHNPMVRLNPEAYGWVQTEDGTRAVGVSVKVPLAGDAAEHHAIVGAFWFRQANLFSAHARAMIEADDRINGEFYIDQCMNYLIRAGLNVHVFEVERYVSWGTPEDLKTYEYWQRFFDQVRG